MEHICVEAAQDISNLLESKGHKSMVLGLILSHINPVYVPHDFKIRLNIQLK
jgi:hypothetical protein